MSVKADAYLITLIISFCASSDASQQQPVVAPDITRWKLVRAGAEAVLTCPVRGSLIAVDWTHRGRDLDESFNDRYRKIHEPEGSLHFERGSLSIAHAQRSDSGVYTCRAVSGWGHLQQNVTLIVCNADCSDAVAVQRELGLTHLADDEWQHLGDLERVHRQRVIAPHFYGMPRKHHVNLFVGQVKELPCQAKGKPRPKIRWREGSNRHVRRQLPVSRWRRAPHRSKPVQVNTLKTGTSNYTCIASNAAGTSHFVYTVTVVRDDPNMHFVGRRQREQHVVSGSSINLTCSVESRTRPKLQWWKRLETGASQAPGDIELKSFESWNRVRFRPMPASTEPASSSSAVTSYHHTLRLTRVEQAVAGDYYCVVPKGTEFDYQRVLLTVDDVSGRGNGTENKSSFNMLPIIISIAVGVAVLLFVVLACICQKRRRHRSRTPKLPASQGASARTLQANYSHKLHSDYSQQWDV